MTFLDRLLGRGNGQPLPREVPGTLDGLRALTVAASGPEGQGMTWSEEAREAVEDAYRESFSAMTEAERWAIAEALDLGSPVTPKGAPVEAREVPADNALGMAILHRKRRRSE